MVFATIKLMSPHREGKRLWVTQCALKHHPLPLIPFSRCTAGSHQRHSEGRGNEPDRSPGRHSDKAQRQTFTLILAGRFVCTPSGKCLNTHWGPSWTRELPTSRKTFLNAWTLMSQCFVSILQRTVNKTSYTEPTNPLFVNKATSVISRFIKVI